MKKYFKPIRVLIALLFFVAILVSFSDIKGNLPSKIHTAFLYLQFTPSILKFITPGTILALGFIIVLAITFLIGRVYCSTICPLGVLQDISIFIQRKFFKNKRLRFRKASNIFRYSILAITLVSLLFTGILFLNLLDPYAVFGRIGSHIYQPILLSINNFVANTLPSIGLHSLETRPLHWASFFFAGGMLSLVIVMSVFSGRLYCNTVCPVGSLLGLVSRFSFFRINISESACTKCGKCQSVCKANCINIKTLEVDETRCISCYNCIPVCNDNAINYTSAYSKNSEESSTKTNSRRRFFLSATTVYLAAKAVPIIANPNLTHEEGEEEEHVCYFSKGPTAPPGALSVDHLKDKCIACHLCVSVCPTKVLQPSFLEYGFTGMNLPKMDYGVNFCNYECRKCGEVCPTGAIIKLPKEEKKLTQIGKVVLRLKHCIVKSENTACGSCSEHCPTQAVKMVPYTNGLTIPEIDPSICIGCGACEYACPVTEPHPAIFVNPNIQHLLAELPEEEAVEFEDTEDFPF